MNCWGLREITIPEGVKSIGDMAFSLCNSLETIKLPESVKFIGTDVFTGCESLTEITFPSVLVFIGGMEAFRGCDSLKRIYYPEGSDGMKSFLSYGNNAELIPIASKKLRWNVEGITLTVGGVREIKDYSTEKPLWNDYLNNIQKIIIEEGVQKVSTNAFSNCLHLEHLIIPASVKTIGDFAFTISYCGERTINNGKNVIWSLDNGVLLIKKNPAVKSDADFSTGFESWQVVEKNIKSVKIERGIVPCKRFFDWLTRQPYGNKLSFF